MRDAWRQGKALPPFTLLNHQAAMKSSGVGVGRLARSRDVQGDALAAARRMVIELVEAGYSHSWYGFHRIRVE